MILGPMEQDVTIKTLNESNAEAYEALISKQIPPTMVPVFIDVRDIAKGMYTSYHLPCYIDPNGAV